MKKDQVANTNMLWAARGEHKATKKGEKKQVVAKVNPSKSQKRAANSNKANAWREAKLNAWRDSRSN